MEQVVVADILNMPQEIYKDKGYIVARLVDARLWYYGIYDTKDRAVQVAIEIGNGLILERVGGKNEK